jgi:hypothetical protein
VASLGHSQSYRRHGSKQAEDERPKAEHDNRPQRQRPRQHCEGWQANRRQCDEQRGSTCPAESELLQDLDDWHFAGGGNDEERSSRSQRWSKPEGVADIRRHRWEKPRPHHAEGKNQHGEGNVDSRREVRSAPQLDANQAKRNAQLDRRR